MIPTADRDPIFHGEGFVRGLNYEKKFYKELIPEWKKGYFNYKIVKLLTKPF